MASKYAYSVIKTLITLSLDCTETIIGGSFLHSQNTVIAIYDSIGCTAPDAKRKGNGSIRICLMSPKAVHIPWINSTQSYINAAENLREQMQA